MKLDMETVIWSNDDYTGNVIHKGKHYIIPKEKMYTLFAHYFDIDVVGLSDKRAQVLSELKMQLRFWVKNEVLPNYKAENYTVCHNGDGKYGYTKDNKYVVLYDDKEMMNRAINKYNYIVECFGSEENFKRSVWYYRKYSKDLLDYESIGRPSDKLVEFINNDTKEK